MGITLGVTPSSVDNAVPVVTGVVDETAYVVEVFREHIDPVEVTGDNYTVEVLREFPEPEEIMKGSSFVEVVEQGGTLVNVGSGPTLPSNPYEGQIWILT